MTAGAITLILGAGGHAKVLVDALLEAGERVEGLLDTDPARHGTTVLGIPVLGDEARLEAYSTATLRLVNGVGSNGAVTGKRNVFDRAKANGHVFAAVIHPTAAVGREAGLGEGVQLMARAVVEAGALLGDNVTINTGAIVNHDCRIGNHVHVAPGAIVLGGVQIGEATHIGAGAIILPGLAIGSECVVAAGAVVAIDVPDRATVAGVPAKLVQR